MRHRTAGPATMEFYETTDFYLACFLRCVGYELADVRGNSGRVTFAFRDRPERRETLMAFYNNEGSVRPLAFVTAIRDLKAAIHNV
jgi:hypothetical protein